VAIGFVMAGVLAVTIAAALIILTAPRPASAELVDEPTHGIHCSTNSVASYWTNVLATTVGTTDLCIGRPRSDHTSMRRNEPITIHDLTTIETSRGPVTCFTVTSGDDPACSQAVAMAHLPAPVVSAVARRLDGISIVRRRAMTWDANDCASMINDQFAAHFTANTTNPLAVRKALGARVLAALPSTIADGWTISGEWCVVHRETAWTPDDRMRVATEITAFLDWLPPTPRPSNAPLTFRVPAASRVPA